VKQLIPNRKHILVIEDEVVTRELICRVLRQRGYTVSEAGGGFEALFLLQATPRPDLILLDLMMGMISGWEFRRCQLQDPAIASVPVILVSAANDLARHARDLDASEWMDKPVVAARLLDTVRRVLECPRSTHEVVTRGSHASCDQAGDFWPSGQLAT
jgi:CheY-like chemotaxis protein